MLNPITLHAAAIDLATRQTDDGSPVVVMRVYTHDYLGPFDIPMLAEHAAAFGNALSEYAAETAPCY